MLPRFPTTLFFSIPVLVNADTIEKITASPVQVHAYVEAECPDCRNFATSVLPILLDNFDTSLVNFDFVAFGNAYFGTDFCGSGPYDPDERTCFYEKCVTPKNPTEDGCFDGDVVYQHAPPHYPAPADREGRLMLLESCVQKWGKGVRGIFWMLGLWAAI